MLRDKGIFEFVEAATELKSQGVQARFILVGDVDPENLATLPLAQLQGWHESGVIEWWGYCRDMLSVFSRTHIVCLPSYREGVPKVLIEAASCGRPIIATNVPGCQEIVRHGENGFLVPVKNSKALADALSRLLSNKVLRQAMGRKGRALVEQEFSLERVIEATFKMYRSLIDLGER
jgi:glycosyltransferase involved in cell wall biosynthesis